MLFNFPPIKTDRTAQEQFDKVQEEVIEYFEATLYESSENQDKEAIDILHAVETFIRVRFRGREDDLQKIIDATIAKNTARNYYDKDCH